MQFFGKYLGLPHAGVDFFLQYLGPALEYLDVLRFSFVTYAMALVVLNNTLGADVDVVVLAEVLGLFVRMLWAKFLRG